MMPMSGGRKIRPEEGGGPRPRIHAAIIHGTWPSGQRGRLLAPASRWTASTHKKPIELPTWACRTCAAAAKTQGGSSWSLVLGIYIHTRSLILNRVVSFILLWMRPGSAGRQRDGHGAGRLAGMERIHVAWDPHQSTNPLSSRTYGDVPVAILGSTGKADQYPRKLMIPFK